MDAGLITRIYSFLLSLFPRRFRDEFGAEMQDVFAQALEEAQVIGERALWAMAFREVRDLLGLALREHWRERKLPHYVPAGDPLPAEPPVPRWAVWISLSLFVIPALLMMFTRFIPPTISSILASPIRRYLDRRDHRWIDQGAATLVAAFPGCGDQPLRGLHRSNRPDERLGQNPVA